jgi:hypothetical protein
MVIVTINCRIKAHLVEKKEEMTVLMPVGQLLARVPPLFLSALMSCFVMFWLGQ